MPANNARKAWETYQQHELTNVRPLLSSLGFELDETQAHLGGERFLMAGTRDVGGGGKKLVLLGKRTKDGTRVVIKISSDPQGIKEIEREHTCRRTLEELDFSIWSFHVPEELLFEHRDPFCILVTAYIAQEAPLLARPLNGQFFLALKAFETQEGVHATTSKHAATINNVFGMADAQYYLNSFNIFAQDALANNPENSTLASTLEQAKAFIHRNKTLIERYCGFLTHADFVPNNLRVTDHTLYLLDFGSLHFGNKYESWARFLNFMVHHHPALEHALCNYVRDNRGPEEYLCLRLMRIYKLGFLLQFWTAALSQTSNNLHKLVQLRIEFWTQVLNAILDDVPVSEKAISYFLSEEARLRSGDEKARQRELIGPSTN